MLTKTKFRLIFLAFLSIAVIFTTCDSPMGMGPAIDWEPPVLTMDPVPNPFYVGNGAQLTGTATDNIGIFRITFTNTTTGEELFPVMYNVFTNEWTIDLNFSEEQNGEKIIGQITAFDKAGNSGEPSIAFVTMIVDIRPPIVENIIIQRTDTRIARLESLIKLQDLETTDEYGEKKDELYRYQNGWFTISGAVNDDETKIEIISLDFYDVRDKSYKLYSKTSVDEGYTNYFPRWTIKEEEIIEAGDARWENYKYNYYQRGERYYYKVVINAVDKSDNHNIEETEGYICLWEKSDEPRGILDPTIGRAIDPETLQVKKERIVQRGNPLPVDFYDDDSLDWAYAGLLTNEQWNGINAVMSGGGEVRIPSYYTNEEKLDWLKNKLRTGETVYNWRFDSLRYNDTSKDAVVAEQIEGKKMDEKLVYIPTGNQEVDYGEFVLFTLAADNKLPPHDKNGPEGAYTNKDRWVGRVLAIQVIDENAPLIVFDTTKKDKWGFDKDYCPEENTFPELKSGASFKIVGYTLRENASGNNSVIKFRMAWIPYGMPDNADKWIPAVQKALASETFAGMPEGVQYWEFVDKKSLEDDNKPIPPQTGNFFNEGFEKIPSDLDLKPGETQSIYKKQSFTKEFNVLGGSDDIKTGTNNFMYNGKLENETKLFIFYAEDNMGHQVFRQLRLLGMKTPPDLSVYDISNKYPNESLPPGIPDPNDAGNTESATGTPTDKYYAALKAFNITAYSGLSTVKASPGLVPDDKTIPFQIYPRGTIVKFWVNAAKTGDIAVKTISMKDITFEVEKTVGSDYSVTDEALSYCEFFPDVTQRTFLFEATDRLGNVARVQRTIAVTNAARLENITTTAQNGTYGIKKEITLTANFSSQIYLEGSELPWLSVRYKYKGETGHRYERIQCVNPPTLANPSLSLNFIFEVRKDFIGQLETNYDGMPEDNPTEAYNKPILLYSAKIMDFIRKDPAFVPGYKNGSVTMPNWQTDANTLQKKKTIILDGVRPIITSVTMGGKSAYSANDYYFKTGETIELTLTADKPIRASPSIIINPRLQYYVQDYNNNPHVFSTDFKYQRPGADNHMLVFNLPVSGSTNFDGKLNGISLETVDAIMDDVGNVVDTVNLPTAPPAGHNYYIKQKVPDAPAATLNGTLISSLSISDSTFYQTPPTLFIPDSTAAAFKEWEDVKQYSLDNGMTWNAYTPGMTIPGGTHNIGTRYVDRAGNTGSSVFRKIEVLGSFPKLISVNAVEPNGWYTSNTGNNSLTFNLNFEDAVRVDTPAQVTITVTNRAAPNTNNPGGTSPSYEMTVPVASGQTSIGRAGASTVKFTWSNISGKEMRDGLYISNITITGLRDKFGNPGVNSTSAPWNGSITIGGITCPNLPWISADACIKVDAIVPKIDTYTPANAGVLTAAGSKTVTLLFNEPVMIGTGKITVKPHGNYKIPAVLENNGSTVKGTYIAGFYDIYNSSDLTADDKNTLTKGTSTTNPSMGNLALDERTGQSAGPYIKLTHGLKEGQGFTGNYTSSNPGANGPSIGGTFMVPDTATKWVLDYRYSIDNANNTQYGNTAATYALADADNTVVPAIRAVLTKAKWRWQEIELISSVALDNSGNTVTITLKEPLLDGLQWDLNFPEGAFTDKAGNPAAAESSYWFWSKGVQAPVIRVNRKSFDARTANWSLGGTNGDTNVRVYNVPADMGGPGGWGIGDFNTIHFRIESETPGATLRYKKEEGTAANNGSITAAWTGDIATGWTWARPDQASGTTTVTNGEWVLPNLVRRSRIVATGTATTGSYNVTENGFPTTRTITVYYQGYRSYNRDVTKAYLEGLSLNTFTGEGSSNPTQDSFTYSALQASKNYVVADAQVTNGGTPYTSDRSYEGVFRSVIAMKQDSFAGNLSGENRNTEPIQVQGSNVKNGMPSISGFPVYDAGETGDNRFLKLFYYAQTTGTVPTNLSSAYVYWVSTEIISQWYFLGRGYTHWRTGDVNNYLYAGYGDLCYIRNGN